MFLLNSKLKIFCLILINIVVSIIAAQDTKVKSLIMLDSDNFQRFTKSGECDDCDCCITTLCVRTEPPYIGNKWKCTNNGGNCDCGCTLGCVF